MEIRWQTASNTPARSVPAAWWNTHVRKWTRWNSYWQSEAVDSLLGLYWLRRLVSKNWVSWEKTCEFTAAINHRTGEQYGVPPMSYYAYVYACVRARARVCYITHALLDDNGNECFHFLALSVYLRFTVLHWIYKINQIKPVCHYVRPLSTLCDGDGTWFQ